MNKQWSGPVAGGLGVALLGTLLWPGSVLADADEITLERIMAHPDWLGNPPESPWWQEDSATLHFEQKREGEDFNDTYRLDPETGDIQRVPAEELGRIGAEQVAMDRDNTRVAWIHEGNVFVQDRESGDIRQLTRSTAQARDVRFLADDRRVAWQEDNGFHAYDLEQGMIQDLGELRFERDPLEEPERFDFLQSQQMRLFDTLARERDEDHSRMRHERETARADETQQHRIHYLGEEIRPEQQSLSHDGDHMILAAVSREADAGRQDQMPNYVTESGYVEVEDVRTKVGQNPPPGHILKLIDLDGGEPQPIELAPLHGIDQDPLADIRGEAVAWHVEQGEPEPQVEEALEAPDERPVRLMGVEWNDSGEQAALMLRSVDNKDRWLAVLDTGSGELETWHRLHDEAWINWDFNDFGWLPDGERLWFLSEESGYSQLYLADGPGQYRALTEGEFVVDDPELDRNGEWFYFTANRDHPGVREVYRVPARGGEMEPLTELGGLNEFALAPNGERLAVRHSTALEPWELYTVEVGDPDSATRHTDKVSEKFTELPWIEPEYVEIPSSHTDEPIHARLYLPPDFDPDEQHPAVFFVHGAGYLQNAHQGWSQYFREFMFHSKLAHEGYVVVDTDYRASAGYGRDWRTAIYRQMGHPEVEDHVDAVDWVVEDHSVDPDRIGVYGGSYGGFLTFMSLFREPGLFAAGAALRPVSDWAAYNHPYTSNILNTPEVDPMAYEKSSPIEFAEGLEDPLLITHGMLDDNVFYQDVVRLTQRLIELEKQDFENAMYPLEPHGFVHPEAWLDQYRRIYKLFEENVK